MLKLKEIHKSFPGVKALDNVSLEFSNDGINALVGENGAGKSTIIKIISGIIKPDSGSIFFNGEELKVMNFIDGLKKGISIVNQELQVLSNASISENIMIDKMPKIGKTPFVNWKKINQEAQKYIDMINLNLPPSMIVGRLSPAQKQQVEIAKALSSDAKILLLDEPTSSISEKEALNLFEILIELKKKKDIIIIFVSHKLDEIFAFCNNVAVLRDGKSMGSYKVNELNRQSLIKLMIGREENLEIFSSTNNINKNEKALEVKNIKKENIIKETSFTLHKSEILGFYGLVGSGRTELAKVIIGEKRRDKGEIIINGVKAKINNVGDALYKYKMGYVTESRREDGLFLDKPIKTNICITIWKDIKSRIFALINNRLEIKIAKQMVDKLDIKPTDIGKLVKYLSGGNQQKVNISKWLASDCEILIFDEPTVGVDVGAKEYIHSLIYELAKKQGKSIILISSEMPEIIKLSDRILVFNEKQIVGEIIIDNKVDNYYEKISEKIGSYYL
ncbi:MAG: sugar ABC transporter ATP-binding protein [Candidatus Humimicrobiaceae bacterium]